MEHILFLVFTLGNQDLIGNNCSDGFFHSIMKPLMFCILCVARRVRYRNDPTNAGDSVRLTACKIFNVAPGGGQGKHSVTESPF